MLQKDGKNDQVWVRFNLSNKQSFFVNVFVGAFLAHSVTQ